jgi:cysteine desulfuration protein SufE
MPDDDDTISDCAQEVVDEFAFFPDWMSRYEHLIELGDRIPEIDEEDKTDEHYIHGCQSDVWIRADYDEDQGRIKYRGDSNAKITKGLAALIIRVLSNQPPEAVVQADMQFLDEIGMEEHLSAQRQNGLRSMIDYMKTRAAAYAERHTN